eukprot:CAMPEP_0198204166 /NCGR_PEP_ID=MMETSP1445-20131203/7549_1 /TAXON_ID=36898 /ORGANISM="Pyramimonas sp., Strain CCMP2087" /LENGTH=44 /DNA_ID= /DNA_START= /DNA_END= /DNA_ORIENTATION=
MTKKHTFIQEHRFGEDEMHVYGHNALGYSTGGASRARADTRRYA